MNTTTRAIEALASLGLSVNTDPVARHGFATDFGNLVRGAPSGILHPRDAGEVASALNFANEWNVTLTPRGFGRSAGGQSVARQGFALDLSRLDRVELPDVERLSIRCEPSATWRSVLAASLRENLIPCVLPLNLDLTVGGTVSVGGIGSNSWRRGLCASSVANLSMIAGSGERVSSEDDSDVLPAVLGGLGRCGVITSIVLNLRPVARKVTTFSLLYEDERSWLADQEKVAREGVFEFMDGFCSASVQGLKSGPRGRHPYARWFFGLTLSVEHDDNLPLDVLGGLSHRWLVNEEEHTTESFAARADPRFESMVRSGAFAMTHPWFEWFVPVEALGDLLPKLLDAMPLVLGDGHRVVMIAAGLPPHLLPATGRFAAVAVLPAGLPRATVDELLPALGAVEQLFLAVGAKRYLAGWLGFDTERWRAHFGPHWERWSKLKNRFDPRGVLSSACF